MALDLTKLHAALSALADAVNSAVATKDMAIVKDELAKMTAERNKAVNDLVIAQAALDQMTAATEAMARDINEYLAATKPAAEPAEEPAKDETPAA